MKQTIKRKLFARMQIRKDKKWLQDLPLVIDQINNTVSYSTSKTPLEIEKGDEKTFEEVVEKQDKVISKRYKETDRKTIYPLRHSGLGVEPYLNHIGDYPSVVFGNPNRIVVAIEYPKEYQFAKQQNLFGFY